MTQLWVLMVVLLTGGLALLCLRPELYKHESLTLLQRAPQAFGLGAALQFMVFLLFSFIGSVPLAALYLPPLLLAAIFAYRRPQRSIIVPRTQHDWSIAEKALLALLVTILLAAIALTLTAPLFDWDARILWAYKAKLLASEPTLSAEAFRDPYRLHIHPRYPVLVPWLSALAAWHQGGFSEASYQVLIWFLAVLGVWQFYLLARRTVARQRALLLTLVMVGTGNWLSAAWSARVEIATVCFLLLALDVLHPEDAPPTRGHQLVAGLILFALAMTKNEGVLLAAGLLLSLLVLEVRRFGGGGLRGSLTLTAVFLLSYLVWLIHLWQIPAVSDENYLQRLRPEFLLEGLRRGDELLLAFLKSMSNVAQWHLFWGIVPVVIWMSFRKTVWQRTGAGLYAAGVVSYLAGVLLIYLVSPWWDIGVHVDVTFERVMLPLLPLTLLLLGQLLSAEPQGEAGIAGGVDSDRGARDATA